MKNQHLWYIRKNNQEIGPFPAAQIRQFLLLGRYTLADEVSRDKVAWLALETVAELIPEELSHSEADLRSARRWADERQYERRKSPRSPGHADKDRRGQESQTERAYREKREDVFRQPGAGKKKARLLTVLLLFLLLIPFFFINPSVKEQAQQDCAAAAQPKVNWSHCRKVGISLQSVDMAQANLQNINLSNSNITMGHLFRVNLEYANLSGTELSKVDLSEGSLKGADLRHASLKDIDLHGADLSYANFFNARLENVNLARARLDHAIWVDGRECRQDSIGECRH